MKIFNLITWFLIEMIRPFSFDTIVQCVDITEGLEPSCNALKKLAGLAKSVWVGQLGMIDAYSIDTNTLDITGFTMALNGSIAYQLQRFVGKKLKHSHEQEIETGENINVINQKVNLVLYHYTSREKYAIEQLVNIEDGFAITQSMAGQLEVHGIDVQGSLSSDDPLGGLNASEGGGGSGVALNDENSFLVSLAGQHRIINRIFQRPGNLTLQQNIDYLNSLSNV